MSLKKQATDLDAKLKTLEYRVKRADEILEEGERSAVERQKELIAALVSTLNILKGTIEETKFGLGESADDIQRWTRDIEEQITTADQKCKSLSDFINECENKEKE